MSGEPEGTTDAARPFARTPLPPDVWEMRDEELERGLELHLALTSIARRIAFREIELLEKLPACNAYFRAFRLRFEKEATEMSEAAKVPRETEHYVGRFYMPEEKPCA